MNYPNDLKYSKSHEWVKTEDGLTLVGISDSVTFSTFMIHAP